jgi:hypothetical protein
MTDYNDDDDANVDFPSQRREHKARAPEYQSNPPAPRRRRPPPEPAAAEHPEPPRPPDRGNGAAEEAPAEEAEGEEKTGYGRPPKHSRFRKGESGNRRGRPKGAKSSRTILKRIGEEVVKVRGPDGKPLKMSRKELSLRKLWERASNGDPKALGMLMAIWADEDIPQVLEEKLTTAQQAMLRALGIDIDEGEEK